MVIGAANLENIEGLPPVMKQTYVYPFVEPAAMVWEHEVGEPLQLTGAFMSHPPHVTDEFTAVIGITGDLRGTVLYQMNKQVALTVASKMIGEPVETLDEMALSALGEMANMMSGNATTMVAQAGYVCDISPPAMLVPTEGIELRLHGTGSHLVVNFTCSLGDFSVRIGLVESSA